LLLYFFRIKVRRSGGFGVRWAHARLSSVPVECDAHAWEHPLVARPYPGRVHNEQVTQLDAVLGLVAARTRATGRLLLVGIGGHGGAGKSTLAVLVAAATGAQVVSTDSFWNGSGFDLERLRAEVLDVLLEGSTAIFDEWDWTEKVLRRQRVVYPEGLVIIEGVCALHQMFRDDLDARVWIEAPYDVRLDRGVERDGEESRTTWVEVWMPNEDAYIERDDPVACADLVLDGTRPFN
jgi:uridine kinase